MKGPQFNILAKKSFFVDFSEKIVLLEKWRGYACLFGEHLYQKVEG